MVFTYRVRKDTMLDEERNVRTVFGVEALDGEGKVVSGFSDVFFDGQKAESFVSLCNDSGLSLIHFSSAVEDALME